MAQSCFLPNLPPTFTREKTDIGGNTVKEIWQLPGEVLGVWTPWVKSCIRENTTHEPEEFISCPAVLFITCVALGKRLLLSGPHFLPL